MKNQISKKIAALALGMSKANVNSVCWSVLGQPKLPKNSEKLKSK